MGKAINNKTVMISVHHKQTWVLNFKLVAMAATATKGFYQGIYVPCRSSGVTCTTAYYVKYMIV